MQDEYTIDGFLKMMEETTSEPDVFMRNYRISGYLEAAKDSWQYAADAEFRALIDKLLPGYVVYEEKMDRLFGIQLEASIILDKATEALEMIRDKMLSGLLPAYAAGNREPKLLECLRELMESDIRSGRFDAAVYGGLTLEELDNDAEKPC